MRFVVASVVAALALALPGLGLPGLGLPGLGLPGAVPPAGASAAPGPGTDPQCTGQGYVTEPDDDQRAGDLMAGRLRIRNFDLWEMPDDLAWTEDPYSDNNWVFQYNSLHWADPLRRVGLATNNQAMLDRYEAIIHDWVQDNPVDDPQSAFAWYDMADGFRAVALVCLAATLAVEPPWLADAIDTHAEMLSDPVRYASNNNHGLYQNLGLLALGCSRDVPAWRDLAVERATALLAVAVDDQGVTNEGSVEYQDSNYSWYRQLGLRLERCDLPRIPRLDRVDLMPAFLAHATQPDGHLIAWGDTSAGAPATSPLGGIHAGPHPDGTFALYDRGYAFSRSGWFDTRPGDEQSLASIRFGEPKALAVHGHQDSGAVSFFALGQQMLWQPGLWGGAGGPPRRYVLSNVAHNVVDIVGATYDNAAETPLIAARSFPAWDLVTVQSHALSDATWQRTMVHVKSAGLLVVDDQVVQPTARKVRQLWQLGADRTVRLSRCTRADTGGKGVNVTLLWTDGCPRLSAAVGQTSPLLGWRSPHVNEFVPSPTVIASQRAAQARMTTVIVPRAQGVGPGQVALLATRTRGATRILDVRVGPHVYEIAFTSHAASVLEVRSPSTTTARVTSARGRTQVRVRVGAATKVIAAGRVTVRVGGRTLTRRLVDGAVTVPVPRLAPGRHRVRTSYAGSTHAAPSRAPDQTYVVRPGRGR